MSRAASELPDKLYFKIGEVARLVGVKPYVLRYWETEFPNIRPGKTRSQHRLYRRRDVETLLEIRRLLHDERYTIEGAKRRLRGGRGEEEGGGELVAEEAAGAAATPAAAGQQMSLPLRPARYREALQAVRRELEALRDLLRAGNG